MYFVDTSALVKLYVPEKGSGWLRGQVLGGFSIVTVTYVEVLSAFARRLKGGSISQVDYQQAHYLFQYDMQHTFLQIEVTQALCQLAGTLVERYALRAYDGLQLAGAVATNQHLLQNSRPSLTFLTADHELLVAAPLEGLMVDDPNNH